MKPEGLRAGADALRYWERRQEVVANNLANASTHGFRGERVFARLLEDGSVVPETQTDWSHGRLTPTGNPLDFALGSDGFFVVATAEGERLVRGGSFRLDESGTLVDASGAALLDESGHAIALPPGRVTVGSDGAVHVDGRAMATLRVVSPVDHESMLHDGAGRFRTDGELVEVAAHERRVIQGSLEESNVETLQAMVDMITVQRSYAAVQSSIRVADGVMNTIANEISRIS